MTRVACLCTIVASLCSGAALAHGTSKSYSEWTLQGRRAEVRVAFASHDVAAAEPALDSDRDGAVSAQELAENSTWLAELLSKQASVHSGGGSPGCVVKGRQLQGLSDPVEEIQLTISFVCAEAIEQATVQAKFLPQLEPPHTSVATFSGPGLDATHVFSMTDSQVSLHVERPPLVTQINEAAQGVIGRALRPRAAVVLLALFLLSLCGVRWRLGLLTAALAAGVAGVATPVFLPLLAAVLVAVAAALLALPAPPFARLVWAAAAGAAFGWGLTWPLMEAEPPVWVAARGLVLAMPLLVVGLGAMVPPRIAERARRPMASGLAAAALALAWLALS